MRNYLLMCTGTCLQVGIKHDGVGALWPRVKLAMGP